MNIKSWNLKDKFKKVIQFILNPRLLLCFGLAWLITNGWSYILMAVGTYFKIDWMIAVAGGYLTFLWLPVSPEKLVTIALAIILLRAFFPKDTKTLKVLQDMRKSVHDAIARKKESRREKKAQKQANE